MWGRKRKTDEAAAEPQVGSLRDAMRQARIEAAERTSVVVDLRDAEVARLELLNEALDPLFNEIPPHIDMFDRAISPGDTPRLWIDMVAHVVMGRDKRIYRFVQDSRFGRKTLTESHEIADIVAAVTDYVARRLIERERTLAEDPAAELFLSRHEARAQARRRRWRAAQSVAFGLILGFAALAAAIWLLATRS